MTDGNGEGSANGPQERRRAPCEGGPASVKGGATENGGGGGGSGAGSSGKAAQATRQRATAAAAAAAAAASAAASAATIDTAIDGATAGRQEAIVGEGASPSQGSRRREARGVWATSSLGSGEGQQGSSPLGGSACAGLRSRGRESESERWRGLEAARARAAGTLSSVACRFARPGTEAELPLPLTAREDGDDPVRTCVL